MQCKSKSIQKHHYYTFFQVRDADRQFEQFISVFVGARSDGAFSILNSWKTSSASKVDGQNCLKRFLFLIGSLCNRDGTDRKPDNPVSVLLSCSFGRYIATSSARRVDLKTRVVLIGNSWGVYVLFWQKWISFVWEGFKLLQRKRWVWGLINSVSDFFPITYYWFN